MSNWRDREYSKRAKNTEDFQRAILGDGLELAIEWIADNLSVENVFKEDEIIDYISDNNIPPEKVFDESVLVQWAEENGYYSKED